MSLFGKKADADPPAAAPKETKQQRAAARNARAAQSREARKAVSAMQPPEPVRGLMAGAVLLAIAVYSFVSKDAAQENKTVDHKTVLKTIPYPAHPTGAVLLAVLALMAIGTIYFKRRLVTVIAFMLAGAVGVDAPLPLSATDLRWLAFIVPAGYALWIIAFRQRKDQTVWLADHPLSGSGSRPARSSRGASRSSPRAGTARKAKQEPLVGANGRALPTNSGRYTQPKSKPRPKPAAQPAAADKGAPSDKNPALKPAKQRT